MLTGELRSQVNSIWNDFWSGGVSNPLSVIEQITYLLFIKRLDELQTVEERKAATLQIPIERRIFPEGKDEKGRPYADPRWSRFKSFEPREMFTVVDEHVLPFLRTLGGEGSAFGQHMKDARLGIPTPALLAKAVEMALAGDTVAIRLCLDRILPARGDRHVPFSLPTLETAADAMAATTAIVNAVAAGELTPSEAAELSKLVEGFAKVIELHNVQQRLEALEAVHQRRRRP